MYLISLYFDKKTEKRIQYLIERVAKVTGNSYLLEHKIPPHLTVGMVSEVDYLEQIQLKSGKVQFVSVGMFKTNTIFLQPILNEYLYQISTQIEQVEGSRYQMFHWIPHVTVGKRLTREEQLAAVALLQKEFGIFEGTVTRIGLAKTKPYEDVFTRNLE